MTRAPKPLVLLLDSPTDELEASIEALDFRVQSGSLGTPIAVERSRAVHPVDFSSTKLPQYTEADVFIVDLDAPTAVEGEPAGETPLAGDSRVMVSAERGVADPRPRAMHFARQEVDRAVDHGACVLAWAAPAYVAPYVVVHNNHGFLEQGEGRRTSNWGLTAELESVAVGNKLGWSTRATDHGIALDFARFLDEEPTEVVLSPGLSLEKRWLPLALNKFGDVVAVLIPPLTEGGGCTVVLPKVKEASALACHVLSHVFPTVLPHHFPGHAADDWLHRDEYSPLSVAVLKADIARVEQDATRAVEDLRVRVAAAKAERPWLLDLLSSADSELVSAVISALEALGFRDVVDVDAVTARDPDSPGLLREDLQIRDSSPLVLGEVKGVSRQPKESECQQVLTYMATRIKDLDRMDLTALTIVNHQRHLPPDRRDHDHVFTQDVLNTAEARDLGLLTTWDLFKLVRGAIELGWDLPAIREALLRSGRVGQQPPHYAPLGTVSNVFRKAAAFTIRLENQLTVGQKVGWDDDSRYRELKVTSMQLEDTTVTHAGAGQDVGIAAGREHMDHLRAGMSIYRVLT